MSEYVFKSDLPPSEIVNRLEQYREYPFVFKGSNKYAERCEVNVEYLHSPRFGLSLKIWGSPGLFTISGGKIEFSGSIEERDGVTYVTGVMENSLYDTLQLGFMAISLLFAAIWIILRISSVIINALAIGFTVSWITRKQFPKKEQMCRFIEDHLLRP